MQFNFKFPTAYKRITTKEVKVGNLLLGNPGGIGGHPIRVQTMTTTNTMDTIATVEQSIRCIEAGAELVRITAPSKNEAENLLNIKNELHKRGYNTPLVADIHFTPNAAEIAARIVEKVRVNPGNYVDKKKFELIEYTDADYAEEIERIQERFTPLVKICKEYGTAMRIGTNHGSLSDRIMSRYGDTPMGMVESAMEFLRIARYESYHNIVLSMKSSNPQVMVAAYRLLVETMEKEFGEIYPLHLGVTEAGDGEDGRIKSAVGIGTLLEDGIGDTIRVSLTEDPELEIPVCKALVKRYSGPSPTMLLKVEDAAKAPSPGEGEQHPAFTSHNQLSLNNETFAVNNIGGHQVPVVIADFSKLKKITPAHLESIGYTYNELTDKWMIADTAADYVFTANTILDFALPGTLKVIVNHEPWLQIQKDASEITGVKYFPIYEAVDFIKSKERSNEVNFVMIDCDAASDIANRNNGRTDIPYLSNDLANNSTLPDMEYLRNNPTVVICLSSTATNAMQIVRSKFIELKNCSINNPVIIIVDSTDSSKDSDEHLIHYAIEAGALLLDGMGDGICFGMGRESYKHLAASYETTDNQTSQMQNAGARSYLQNNSVENFINNTAFGILQATRKRISKTEYISCPSCGRTLFDLQETTAKIRAVTNHLKGVKIAVMGCIVNGPGEMADADFGYVGSGPGKITLYKSKDVVKRNVPSEVAVQELINLLKESDAWVEPQAILKSTN